MKRLSSGVMLALFLISTLTIVYSIKPVKGWAGTISPCNLHERMTRDALEGLVEAGLWRAEDIGDIPKYSNEVDQVLPHCKLSCHRVTQFQRIFEIYGGDICNLTGAEWEASYYISMARKSYVAGDTGEFQKYLGYAIHYIQDAACPPHVFPFQEGVGNAHYDFEEYTAREYDSKNWKQLIKNASIQAITNINDLLIKVNNTANWVNETYQPPRVGYIRQDGVPIGDLPEGWDWFMTDEDIGEIMKKIASLVKGAALYACIEKIEVISIKSDGSINPQAAPICRVGDVYTFTDNVYAPLVVEKSDIIIDGQGYTLYGTGRPLPHGITLDWVNNVTITNMKIESCGTGIYFNASSNCKVHGCYTTNNWKGIELAYFQNSMLKRLEYSMNNSIYGNIIANNTYDGILCDSSSFNQMYDNIIKNNKGELTGYSAAVRLSSSRYNSIYNNYIVDNGYFSYTFLGTYGLLLQDSSYNRIFNNNISNNLYWGILLDNSKINYIAENIIKNNTGGGIILDCSSHNVIYGNNITKNGNGIRINNSTCNGVVINNIIDNSLHGIWLEYATDNSIYGNDLKNNHYYGIRLTQCEKNEIWHNNFMDNLPQNALVEQSGDNYWNRVYPYGGNYWSDYTGVDEKGGPLQNQPGSDGIGDTPYCGAKWSFTDSYPFMNLCVPERPSQDYWMTAFFDILRGNEVGINIWWTLRPVSLSISQGNSRIITIVVMAIYDANQPIQLKSFFSPVTPSDVTVSILPQQVNPFPSGFATLALTIIVGSSAEPGCYTLNVDGRPFVSLEIATLKFTFNVSWEDINYPVNIFTNSTVIDFNFDQPSAMLSFIIRGESGVQGYCNVSIPKSLLRGEPWALKLNGTNWSFTVIENETHSFIYFTYTHMSTYEVLIQGTWVIPEFPSATILLILMLITLIATILVKNKREKELVFKIK